ncbi:TraH family protein [Pararhizobium antarcticum]|uniref:Conjugal transfer protein TraH n=1 Tax=Pararhizobium antarcticum TaxID=1798805 RepID=A0A657LN48_9HYPH|nr:TraH family protein [Pararhizobium antarcticum]OJF91493.1 conjugal transfer protein TraH [Pararhizobium antarcticum]OJF99485.1 conjugal transfer protein TraH [Rhizobium sp. 58]
MLDAALIQQCADPSLKSAIVEQFIEAAGAPDPLTVTVKSGSRVFLVPMPKTTDEAMVIIRENVGRAVVRVGLTQFPAGVGIKEASELTVDLVDACANLRMGSQMFAKILRIVSKWYGNPKSDEVFPQIFEDAVYAWKTGEFEGVEVFQAEDPGGSINNQKEPADVSEEGVLKPETPLNAESGPQDQKDINASGMRIDLSRILGN